MDRDGAKMQNGVVEKYNCEWVNGHRDFGTWTAGVITRREGFAGIAGTFRKGFYVTEYSSVPKGFGREFSKFIHGS